MTRKLTDMVNDALRPMRDPLFEDKAGSIIHGGIELPTIPEVHDDVTVNPAKWTYERLAEYIKTFEANLDEEHEIGARLVSFGQTLTFHIDNIGYYGPDIITFYGTDLDGQAVQLVQHTSQLNILLKAVKKQSDKPRRIGFVLEEKNKAP